MVFENVGVIILCYTFTTFVSVSIICYGLRITPTVSIAVHIPFFVGIIGCIVVIAVQTVANIALLGLMAVKNKVVDVSKLISVLIPVKTTGSNVVDLISGIVIILGVQNIASGADTLGLTQPTPPAIAIAAKVQDRLRMDKRMAAFTA